MQKIQRLFKRTIIIFGSITILLLCMNTHLNNQVLLQSLGLSFVISLFQTLFFKEIVFSYSIPFQMLFIVLVWGITIGANYLFAWNYQVSELLVLLVTVLVIYFGIRIITYYQVKDEADKMNRFLKDRKRE